MSEQHTQGLLKVSTDGSLGSIESESGLHIGQTFQTRPIRTAEDHTERKENARRLVACWNSCQGIDTADLEAGSVSIVAKMHDEAAKLVLAQRDELLAVLKRSRPFIQAWPQCRDSETPHIDGCGLLEAVDAAIASVKGGG